LPRCYFYKEFLADDRKSLARSIPGKPVNELQGEKRKKANRSSNSQGGLNGQRKGTWYLEGTKGLVPGQAVIGDGERLLQESQLELVKVSQHRRRKKKKRN